MNSSFDPFKPQSPDRKPVVVAVCDPGDPSATFNIGVYPVGNDAFLQGIVQDEVTRLEKIYCGKPPTPMILEEQNEAFQPTETQIQMAAGVTVSTRGGVGDCKIYDSETWLRILYKWPALFSDAMLKINAIANERDDAHEKKATEGPQSSTPLPDVG